MGKVTARDVFNRMIKEGMKKFSAEVKKCMYE